MNLSGLRSLRSEIQRLKKRLAEPAPEAEGPPPGFWDWIVASYARQPFDEEVAAECRAFWLSHLPPDFDPKRNRIEERIEAALNERLRNERPRCGLVELAPDPALAGNANGLTPPPSAAADAQQG
jgi:hypothetical protein